MSLITSGLTWQVDFTNQSSLIISTSGGGNPQIDKATNLANPSLFFSGVSNGEPLYVYSGFSGPLGFSGTAQANGGGPVLTNKLGDYGSFTEYTMFFMVNNTGGTYNQFITSPVDPNYLGQTQGYDWFESTVTTDPAFGGAGFFYRTKTTTSLTNDLRASGNTNNWYVVGTRVYQSGSDIITDIWVDGVLTGSTTTSSQTLFTAVDPIFFITGRQSSPGDILYTEALFYDRKLDNTEMTDNFDYFNQKYFVSPVTPTPTPTITSTPTNTQTPSATPTVTPTISVTPSNTPTPSITPSVSASGVPQVNINFKTIADDFLNMSNYHKQINSFGLGNIDGISYLTTSRDKQDNPHSQPPIFPLLYVVPSTVVNDLQYKTWEFNSVVMDIVQRDLSDQVDTLSDTLQMLQDIISQFRLSVTAAEGLYNNKYYLDEFVNCTPFMEDYADMTNGWNGLLKLKTMTPLNRCAAAYNTWTGTPIVHDTINIKTFHDDFRTLSEYHKQINSFGFGQQEDLSFWTEMRDKVENTHFNSPIFPLLYVIPNEVEQKFGFMQYNFTLIVMDIVERDLTNQIDVLSDTNQIMDDIISQFRLSVTNSLGNFNAKYTLQNPVVCIPFIEQYTDLTAGWSAQISVEVMNSLNRCDAAFNSWLTPSPTATPTNTPTVTNTPTNTATITSTPTNTPTQTCPVTTQYLEVQLSENTKFKLVLWNQPDYTSPATANCDYIISGTAYGSLGTVYTGTETIDAGQHQHQFNLAPVLQPGETVIGFDVYSYTLSGCPCPVDLILPISPTPTPTVTNTPSVTPTNTSTPTPSVTQTMTATNTQTPSETATNTPTPSITPTFTPTPSSTPTIIPPDDCIWNTNNTDWNDETNTWDSCFNTNWDTNINQWQVESEPWND